MGDKRKPLKKKKAQDNLSAVRPVSIETKPPAASGPKKDAK